MSLANERKQEIRRARSLRSVAVTSALACALAAFGCEGPAGGSEAHVGTTGQELSAGSPYELRFYTEGHVIGYTGTLGRMPTVYFLEALDTVFVKFGRITQDHGDKDNIGRNRTKVREASRYSMKNEYYRGKVRLVERYDGEVFHYSRNRFVPVSSGDEVVDELAEAIIRFPDWKPKYGDRWICDGYRQRFRGCDDNPGYADEEWGDNCAAWDSWCGSDSTHGPEEQYGDEVCIARLRDFCPAACEIEACN